MTCLGLTGSLQQQRGAQAAGQGEQGLGAAVALWSRHGALERTGSGGTNTF